MFEESARIFGKAYGTNFYDTHPWFRPGKGFPPGHEEPLTEGLDEKLAYFKEQMRAHAPIDGILGFSEGANVASLLVREVMAEDPAALRFAVHLNAGKPDWIS